MQLRTLRADEIARLLDLLDLWDLGGYSGREFFGGFFDADPTFEARNVWVAEADGELVSSVQVFPRALRVGGVAVATGGIGTVFTHPERRGGGTARALLERALADMRARGMLLSLLFAAPLARPLYERSGYRSWWSRRTVLRPAPGRAAPETPAGLELADFDAERDLDAVKDLRERYAVGRDGIAERDDALWRCTLRFIGARAESFRLVRRAGRLAAFVRAIPMEGFLVVTEVARREDAADALAMLLADLLGPRDPDPLAAAAAKASADFRAFAALPETADPALERALDARGVARQDVRDPTPMLACLDAGALARRVGAEPVPDESPNDALSRLLPPERFVFWLADRF